MTMWATAILLATAGMAHAGEISAKREGYTLQGEETGSGKTTVVFEAGFGQGPGAWKQVIAGLGADYRSVAYARAGLGKSGSDGVTKRIDDHLNDLSALIETVAPDQQVILVGHSYGGLLVTEFARRHPQRVRGIVLVDPATMGQRLAYRKADAARVQADDAALLAMLPPSMAADYRVLVEQLDAADAASERAMPDVPVALLTATQVADEPLVFEETAAGKVIWKAQHALLFSTFARGVHRYVATGHSIAKEDPAAVVQAIGEMAAIPDIADR
ncbi:alpha/beta hydrolase [Stenotrophomonas cyclobalanopsidis]|uniref:Alpha/beta hydrolase n=2 Tax=Stenotrophomonas cyclobalanopsidis TaxID=2771362 RepID=A0ABQ6SXB5_9GAMM|nr:alpha/beta hydrolase [Stenotrophomonas cyclobalanopsidis]KAA8994916.1 alpha/beta hydrolase [Stenotrophomonas cyclobalanopsidis]